MTSEQFDALHADMLAHAEGNELLVQDLFGGADKTHRLATRVVTELAWHSLFIQNLLIEPQTQELDGFDPEFVIMNFPNFKADPARHGSRGETMIAVNFDKKMVLICGTSYAGETKKSVFSMLNYTLPAKRVMPMHCSVNVGEDGDSAVFFGLSGTGKTTLSADPNRKLIGDDEHGWCADNTIFNFEGGCYAKVIDLSAEKEPDIFNAIKPHAILENVVLDESGSVDFGNSSITQNTRVSYTIHHIKNIQPNSLASNPKNIFFLTADAYGVLPPISKLTPAQAAYHFISGYTAKVAGTEEGVTEPKAVFSACFGAPFMPLHPTAYADMLAQKMKAADTNVWLINTGWSGGSYGAGKRMKLSYTRTMITAAMNR